MVNKTETTFLVNKKVNQEGKSYRTAYSEINNLNGFEYDLRRKNREIKTLKSRLEKANELNLELKEKLKNKSTKDFKEKFKDLQKSEDIKDKVYDLPTTKDLNRILSILDEGEIGLSDLTKTCVINNSKVRDMAFNFLERNNLIKIRKDGSRAWVSKI
jgi:DNA-binding transcriptional regulator GbsR (MarR family)